MVRMHYKYSVLSRNSKKDTDSDVNFADFSEEEDEFIMAEENNHEAAAADDDIDQEDIRNLHIDGNEFTK